jgi:hypothetical protein
LTQILSGQSHERMQCRLRDQRLTFERLRCDAGTGPVLNAHDHAERTFWSMLKVWERNDQGAELVDMFRY